MNKALFFLLFLISSILLLIFPHLSTTNSNLTFSPLTIEGQFNQWTQTHNKIYSSQAEKAQRLQIFSENLKLIEDHNKKNLSYTMKLNKFADLTSEEFTCNLLETLKIKKLYFFSYLSLFPPSNSP
jgi:Cathepsin propeptide inhibitor domain (I29)